MKFCLSDHAKSVVRFLTWRSIFFCAMRISSVYYLFLWVYKVLINKSGKALLLLLLLLFAGYYLMFCGSLINPILSSSHQSIQLGYQKIKSRSPKEHSKHDSVLSSIHHIPRHSLVTWSFTVPYCFMPPSLWTSWGGPPLTLVLNVSCSNTCISHSIWMSQSWIPPL